MASVSAPQTSHLSQPLQPLILRAPRLPVEWSYWWRSPPQSLLPGSPSPVDPAGAPGPLGGAQLEGQNWGHLDARAPGIGSGWGCFPSCRPGRAEGPDLAAPRLSGPGASLISQSSTPHKNKCKARNEKCVHILQHFQTLKKKPTEVNLQWQNGGVSQSFLWPCSKREFVLCKVSNPN